MLPELLLILLGAAVRLSFIGHDRASYDLVDHQRYIEWFRDHLTLPPLELSRLTYGPPLYHALAGGLLRWGGTWDLLIGISALLGTARLLLLWWALARALPDARLGRLAALALAAVLPAAVHIDGMINNESLSMLACWGVMACWLRAGDASPLAPAGSQRWAVVAGVLLAAALLTKFSGVMLLIAALGAFALDLLRRDRARARAWLTTAVVACTLAAPYYLRNLSVTGRLFPTAFEAADANALRPETRAKPIYERRPPSFFWEVTPDIYTKPYYPNGSGEFLSTLLAATYSDHSAYHFAPRGPKGPPEGWTPRTTRMAGLSVAGGTVIALASVLALVVALWGAARRGDTTQLALLGTSVLAVAGQLYFATKYPLDHYGVIKATYLQFGAAPLYVCFGGAVSWAQARGVVGSLVAAALLIALFAVAAFTVSSRVGMS